MPPLFAGLHGPLCLFRGWFRLMMPIPFSHGMPWEMRTLHSVVDRRPAQHFTCDFAPAFDVTARCAVMKRQLEALEASYFFDSMSETMFPARPAILLLRDAS